MHLSIVDSDTKDVKDLCEHNFSISGLNHNIIILSSTVEIRVCMQEVGGELPINHRLIGNTQKLIGDNLLIQQWVSSISWLILENGYKPAEHFQNKLLPWAWTAKMISYSTAFAGFGRLSHRKIVFQVHQGSLLVRMNWERHAMFQSHWQSIRLTWNSCFCEASLI